MYEYKNKLCILFFFQILTLSCVTSKAKTNRDNKTLMRTTVQNFLISKGYCERSEDVSLQDQCKQKPVEKPSDHSCGFSDSTELFAAAQKSLETFHASSDFKPTFWVTKDQEQHLPLFEAMVREGNQKKPGEQELIFKKYPWAKDVYSDYEVLMQNPALEKLRTMQLATLAITTDDETCDSFCTDYGHFTVTINAGVASSMFDSIGTSAARQSILAILGHELGHYIQDYYYKVNNIDRLQDGLKTHLTVDAIGLLLTGLSIDNMISSLSLVSEGDLPDRIRCFKSLQKTKE